MALVLDPRALDIQRDPQQVRSINDFTDSLGRELGNAEGAPSKVLIRELLGTGLRRALELGGQDTQRRFLESLRGNIHKFALQEQRSLSRVFPVEISSEYRNLASFVEDAGGPDDPPSSADPPAPASAAGGLTRPTPGGPGAAVGAESAVELRGPLGELRRRLQALPARPGPTAEELVTRLADPETSSALAAADSRSRAAFFQDLRLNLYKLPENAQKELVDRLPDLRAEVAHLVESMTQEISRWLEEERAAARSGAPFGLLVPKLGQLFQALLGPSFLAASKLLGGPDKRGKENFLLKLALCLRDAADKAAGEAGADALLGQATQLRRQFFHVDGYGELMEDWLQNRLKQFSEEFTNRAGAVLAANPQPILARLRRTFRPGRWLSMTDPQVEEDLYALFLDENFPRHVLSNEAIARVLQRVASYGGAACDFHVYRDIARLPPAPGTMGRTPPPQDSIEAALLQLLQRLPPFPPLRRLRPGVFLFGKLEVEFFLRGPSLLARLVGSPQQEEPADEFFAKRGPEEFPSAALLAVQGSAQNPGVSPTTLIEPFGAVTSGYDAGARAPPPLMLGSLPGPGGLHSGMAPVVPPPQQAPLAAFGGSGTGPLHMPHLAGMPGLGATHPGMGMGLGLCPLPRGPPIAPSAGMMAGSRYQPYPAPGAGGQIPLVVPPPLPYPQPGLLQAHSVLPPPPLALGGGAGGFVPTVVQPPPEMSSTPVAPVPKLGLEDDEI